MNNKAKVEGKHVVIVALIIGLAIVIVGLLAYQGFSGVGGNKQTVSANGVSEINAEPDLVVVYFNAQATGSSAEKVRDDVAEIIANLESNLASVVNADEIETENFNIYPNYNYQSGRNEIISYTATHSIKVSSENFDNAGKIVDEGVNAGALISYINFELTEEHESELKKQAIKAATEDAREKAEAIAEGLNAKLGKVVSVSTSDFSYYPYRYYDFAEGASTADAVKAATDISPRDINVNSNVQVIYEIR